MNDFPDFIKSVFGDIVSILIKLLIVLVAVMMILWFVKQINRLGKAGKTNTEIWYN